MLHRLFIGSMVSWMLLATACKNSTEQETPLRPLEGTWYIENIAITGCVNKELSFACTASDCLKLQLDGHGKIFYTKAINGNSVIDNGTYLILDHYIEICKNNGTTCSNYELIYEPGAFYFATKDLDPTTGCATVTTYVKV